MKLITINYLANNRTQYFSTIFNQLIKIKPENKEKISVNILSSREEEPDIDINLLTDNGIEANYIYQSHLGRHYMGKVEKAVEMSGKYYVSLDEDIFINTHIWDFMIENCSILDDDDIAWLSPLLSSGIPSID